VLLQHALLHCLLYHVMVHDGLVLAKTLLGLLLSVSRQCYSHVLN